MPRLLFEKCGNAVWVSHLDLMRIFQRAFKRAGLSLTHTQGFNPRPSVSIALPLSVGVSSSCELLDFELDTDAAVDCDEVRDKLNRVLVEGVRILQVYNEGRKIRDLTHLRCKVEMHYDNGVPTDACDKLSKLFACKEIIVPKKTKSGVKDQNIADMIKSLSVSQVSSKMIVLDAIICCQNPTLNPMQLPLAGEMYLPELKPDHSSFHRIEIYDSQNNVFR